MKKQDIHELTILDSDLVRVVKTRNNIDIRFTQNNEQPRSEKGVTQKQKGEESVKRLDKDTYYDPMSGTVKEYDHKEKRIQNESTFFRTSRELNWVILNSFEGKENEIMCTLTFKNKVEEIKEVNRAFNNFVRRLNTFFKKTLMYEYIVIREPHLSGSWHMHMLFKYNVIMPSSKIPASIGDWHALINDKWKQGMVDVRAINQINELSAYLTKHLMDIKVDENGEEIESFSEGMSVKTGAKNKRLDLYPLGMKIYSYSKGIKKPPKKHMTYGEAKRRYDADFEKNYDNSFILYNDDFALMQRQIQLTKKD